jgi:hypothetical protein
MTPFMGRKWSPKSQNRIKNRISISIRTNSSVHLPNRSPIPTCLLASRAWVSQTPIPRLGWPVAYLPEVVRYPAPALRSLETLFNNDKGNTNLKPSRKNQTAHVDQQPQFQTKVCENSSFNFPLSSVPNSIVVIPFIQTFCVAVGS